jgi:hypothetical protein
MNITQTLITANKYGLKLLGLKSGLVYFNDPKTGSTLAIESSDFTPDNLVSTFYRYQYNMGV